MQPLFISALLVLVASIFLVQAEVNSEDNPDIYERVKRTGLTYYHRYSGRHRGRSCGDPGTLKHGYSWYHSRHTGSIVVHSCKSGYALVGAKLRTCQSNGKWRPKLPECVYSKCVDPGTPDNAIRYLSSTTLHSVVKYKCKPGYRLSGSSYRVCQASGEWSGIPPKCTGSGCRELSNPANGQVDDDERRIGDTAIYSCNSGYALVGVETRVCEAGGIWSGSAPTCELGDCGLLSDPQNGLVSFSSTSFGSTARYSCDSGFVLVGASKRTCQANGKWSKKMPVCKPLSCGRLDAPDNGKVVISGTTPGSITTYSCNPGFELVGVSKRTCQNNGEWSADEPFCEGIVCEDLAAPTNGFIIFSSGDIQRPGDEAEYSCFEGYRLSGGDRIRICQVDTTYTGTAPSCIAIGCGNLRDPPNGRVSLTGEFVGDQATYTCNRGFVLDGDSVRTCQTNTDWDGSEPICRPVDCGRLLNPRNGRVTMTTTRFGGTAKYICNDGFELVGAEVRRCEADGDWSGTEPSCRANECGLLFDPLNGSVDLTGITIGSTALYSCDLGFLLIGQSQRDCQQNGEWSGREPTCLEINCEPLQDPLNGHMQVSGNRPGAVASYVCNPGFILIGHFRRSCELDGTFLGQAPICRPIVCEQLEAPRNGRVEVSGSVPGSQATYTCDIGFELIGETIRICQNNGRFSGSAPTCQQLSCESLQDPANGRVQVSGDIPGAVASYTCNPGFSLVGQSRRTCQRDGSFSGQAPTCRPIVCEQLEAPRNGRVEVSGSAPGDQATYSCNAGFDLIGQTIRICQNDGTFSERAPTCQQLNCGPLSDPLNGQVDVSSTSVSSLATYQCNIGYILVGVTQRICQPNRQWSNSEPICAIIDCGLLPDPLNGDVDFSSTTFLSKATYSCFEGYTLVGIETRTCQANGQWSEVPPFCQPIFCDNLENPDNGFVVVRGNTAGAIATYTCNPGFELIGQEERVCQSDGSYSGQAPICRIVDCGQLQDPANGIVKFGGTTVGSTATYACNKGFTLMGSNARVCQPNGKWSRDEPVCSLIYCEQLVPPPNGDISFTSTTFGAIATYRCDIGYVLQGAKTRTCEIDGKWYGLQPFCQAIDCGPLDSPLNILVEYTETIYGSTAIYSCNQGYYLKGIHHRHCQENGKWSNQVPICTAIDCSLLSDSEYGSVEITGTFPGSIATYACNKGFVLIGSDTRECRPSGEWSGQAPICKPEDCGFLDNPLNGVVDVSGTAFWDSATYSCNQGYELVGAAVRTCEENGEWSDSAPYCRPADCGFLLAPSNGRISLTGTVVNSIATYSCFSGYELIGSVTRTCAANGQWSNEAPFCRAIECGPLQNPKNGQVVLTGLEVFSVANYECDNGFGINGLNTRVCQPDGTWSGVEPTCEPSDCGDLRAPRNGLVETTGTKYWDTATYSCIAGYYLVGESERTCEDIGLWSGVAPSCQAINCGILDNPNNGRVDFNSVAVRSQANYFCNPGYQLIGESTRICEVNGEWSGQAPFCQRVVCDDLAAPANGRLILTQGNLVGSVATYSCFPGYVLEGNEQRTCLDNMEWTGSDPFCIAANCLPLTDPPYGYVIFESTTVGSIATYSCIPGFEIYGEDTRECLSNNFWSGIEPLCEPTGCGQLPPLFNGRVDVEGTNVDDKATYSCDSGFDLVGNDVRMCRPNGKWSGQSPICIGVNCDQLQDPFNGQVTVTGTSPGSEAFYTCDSGFALIGDSTRYCLPNGEWTGSEPTCEISDCGLLLPPENGDIRVPGTSVGITVRYSCFIGYQLDGESTRVCQSDGTWSGDAPFCIASQCPDLQNPNNGRVIISGTTIGSVASYRCDDGFVIDGLITRICQDQQTWSGSEPQCRRIDCGPLFAPINGNVEVVSTTFGSIARYSCNIGYLIVGTQIRTCQNNGQWSDQEPFCDEITINCETLFNPENGEVLLSGTSQGDIATYTCFNGFVIVGDDIRYCQNDGRWTGREPLCRPNDCGPLEDPANGEKTYIGSGFGAVVRYSCFPGYKLIGDVSRTCKSDGLWSGDDPVCIPDQTLPPPPPPPLGCGDPGTPRNGIKIGNDYSVGSVVSYECNNGYELIGSRTRICSFDGFWTGSVPSCVTSGECTGSGRIEDSCGSVCDCENGFLVNCCRLRKDFGSLTEEERLRYIQAVLTVSSDPVYQIRYYELLENYKASFGTDIQNTDYRVSQFLIWNRYFLLEYENLLKEIDCRINLPYYDWTIVPVNPYISIVWDEEVGFGKSSREIDFCVNNGPFQVGQYSLIPSAGGGCLKREYRNEKFPTRSLVERDVLTQPAEEFGQFHRHLQVFIHTSVRCFIGGTMCTTDAANDPVFILHLAMLDSIYDRWQGYDDSRLNARYANDNSQLLLASGRIVSEYHNNKNLPDNIAICYDEPTVKSHVSAGRYFLAQSFTEITNKDKFTMGCLSNDSLDKIGGSLSDEDKEFIKSKCNKNQ